ncbi:MAG: acyl-CoA hydrolase [Planctomycetota bacterium]|nr:MAG: acyl-CoA hydrolase [Planctomycetota bacterium]
MQGSLETVSHRLVLPADANHHGTLYAGSLLRYALETAYASGSRGVGTAANLMLRRVVTLECRRSVPVGALVELRGAILQVRQCYLVVGVVGMPLEGHDLPWMDGLMGFVQVDAAGAPAELPGGIPTAERERLWQPLAARLEKLSQSRGATAGWIGVGLDRS